MRIRFLLSSAAVVGAFLATTALVNDALAQKGTVMAPSTAWTVSKVDNQGGAYCAMARQFNQNTVLTIAQNERSEASFALDFQKPVFSPQAGVSVVLDPGAGQQRAYETKPASNKAFVVRMGRDSRFFKALERTGVLRVEVSGKSYHFNVADIDIGQSKLHACVANMVMPAAGDEIESVALDDAGLEKAVKQAGKKFRQEINSLRREIKTLKDQNTALETQIETRAKGPAESSVSVSRLAAQIRELEDKNALLRRQVDQVKTVGSDVVRPDGFLEMTSEDIAALRAENLRLQAELQTQSPEKERIVSLEIEVQALQAQNKDLQNTLHSQEDNDVDVTALRGEIAGLEAENTALNAKILEVRQSIEGEYKNQVAALSAENVSLKNSMSKKGVDAELLEQLRQQIAQAENENRLLNETAAHAQKNMEAQFKQDNEKVVAAVRAEQEGKIASLEKELQVLKADDKAALVALGADTAALQAVREENKNLRAQITAMDVRRTQAEAMVSRIEGLEQENKALKEQVLTLDVAGEDVNRVVAGLQEENTVLKSQLEEGSQHFQKIGMLEQEVSSLKALNSSLQDQAVVDGLRSELQAALDVSAMLKGQIKSKDLELLELGALRQQLTELKQSADQASEKAQNIVQLEAQRDELKSVLSDVVAVAEKFKIVNKEQKLRIENLESERAELLAMQADVDLADGREAAEGAVQIDNSAVDALRVQVSALENENKQLKSVLAERPEVQVVSSDRGVKKRALLPEPVSLPSDSLDLPEPGVVAPSMKEAFSSGGPLTAGELERALLSIEEQMGNTHKDDQRRMQELARAYVSLKAQLEGLGRVQVAAPTFIEASANESGEYVPVVFDGLNEAQAQERALKLSARQEEAAGDDSLVIQHREDPFKGMRVEGGVDADAGRRVANVDGGAIDYVRAAAVRSDDMLEQASYGGVDGAGVLSSVRELIAEARVFTADKIQKVAKTSGDVTAAYQWNGGSVYGSAEEKPLSSPVEFDRLVQDYIERTEMRCPGDFAVVPDNSVDRGDLRADSYEVACVGDTVSAGASLLFYNQGGTFTVVAHEAPTSDLGAAMNFRNKLMRFVTGS